MFVVSKRRQLDLFRVFLKMFRLSSQGTSSFLEHLMESSNKPLVGAVLHKLNSIVYVVQCSEECSDNYI